MYSSMSSLFTKKIATVGQALKKVVVFVSFLSVQRYGHFKNKWKSEHI